MNSDENQLKAKSQRTASITLLVAGVLMILPLFFPKWLKGHVQGMDLRVSLFSFEACGDVRDWENDKTSRKCESMSNAKFIDALKENHQEANGAFPFLGWAVFIVGLGIGIASLVSGGLGMQGKFIRDPIAPTTIVLVGALGALVLTCVWVAIKPGYVPHFGPVLGLSWPFFVFSTGVITGIVGAQMLAKAHADVRDPYWDGVDPPAT